MKKKKMKLKLTRRAVSYKMELHPVESGNSSSFRRIIYFSGAFTVRFSQATDVVTLFRTLFILCSPPLIFFRGGTNMKNYFLRRHSPISKNV